MTSDAGHPTAGRSTWNEGYVERLADLWGRSTRASTEIAAKWSARSLEDREWTVDTVTSDLIEVSEVMTPLVGEAVDLWLELVQRSLARVGQRGR